MDPPTDSENFFAISSLSLADPDNFVKASEIDLRLTKRILSKGVPGACDDRRVAIQFFDKYICLVSPNPKSQLI